MAKTRDRYDLSCVPVDVFDLRSRLAAALGINTGAVTAREIVDCPFPPLCVDTEGFRDAYLLKEVVRKYPGFDLGVDTRAAALSTFLEDERLNAATNDRLLTYDAENPRVHQIIFLAARKAVEVLGRFDWKLFVEGMRFGPGATTRLSGETATVSNKLTGVPHVSLPAYGLMHTVISMIPSWGYEVMEANSRSNPPGNGSSDERDLLRFVVENYDRFASVFKDALTDRTIGIPPDLNIYGQLAVGRLMRIRMFPYGINLNDQTINQRRCRQASIDGRRATLDLKGASNSTTCSLVWKLLGDHSHEWKGWDPTWYKVLDALRTIGCRIDGEIHEYELFSAMGNGFTFELESLIFWSLAHSVCVVLGVEADISVYGDDLIVPVETVDLLTEVLGYCGFRINEKKSFSTTEGPLFRESCGVHYLDGHDVTPFYVDDLLERGDQILLLANNIVRWARRKDGSLDGRLLPVWLWVVGHLSDDYLKFGIPYGESNDGLLLSFEQVCPSTAYLGNPEIPGCTRPPRAQLGIGYTVKTVAPRTRTHKVDGESGLRAWLYEAEKRRFVPPTVDSLGAKLDAMFLGVGWEPGVGRGSSNPFPLVPRQPLVEPVNGRKKSLKTGKRVVKVWPRLGPWCNEEGPIPLGSGDLQQAKSFVNLL